MQMTCSGLTVGSNTAPSRQNHVTFPAADSNNVMLGFAAFDNGFGLQNSSTTCTYDNFLPVSGPINLNNGRLILRQDFIVNNNGVFTNVGTIRGNAFKFELAKKLTDTAFPSPQRATPFTINETTMVLNSKISLNAPVHFRSHSVICGRGNRLTISKANPIVVRPNSTLILQDIELAGVGDNNLRCLTDSASITLRNCLLILERDFTFSRGAFLVEGDVLCTGTNKFNYTAVRTSTIAADAMLAFDLESSFSYAPLRPSKNLLYMTDKSSLLYLNGCSLHSTRTGLELSQGTILFDNKVTVSSQARSRAEAMRFKNTLDITILSGALVDSFGVIEFE